MTRCAWNVSAYLVLVLAGCAQLARAPAEGFPAPGAAAFPAPADMAQVLLGAGEEELAPSIPPAPAPETEAPTPEPEEVAGGTGLRFGAGFALPGGGEIGSAPGATIPAWSDVWTAGFVLEGVYEFRGGRARPYAEFAYAQFYGQRWTNPSNSADSWIASDGGVATLAGGAKFGLGRTFYAKAALGLLFWPQVSRIDYYTGGNWPILDAGASVALALGGGAEFELGKLRAYADLEFALGTKPSDGTEDAMLFWPSFEAAGVSELKLTGGVRLSF